MFDIVEARCIVCSLVFCCSECRRSHEKNKHGLKYDCPICRGNRFLCIPEHLNQEFVKHLTEEHLPLQCKKCDKTFDKMEDFTEVDKCITLSELIDNGKTNNTNVEDKFDSLFDKINKSDEDNIEAVVSVNKSSRTAIITPIIRRKYLVDYEYSDTESEDGSKIESMETPHPKVVPKTPKVNRQRAATPHVKKFLRLMKQKVIEEDFIEKSEDGNLDEIQTNSKTTPSRNENDPVLDSREMTTPTSNLPHIIKVVQTVTTSTPTHPAASEWSMFTGQLADSPLSEIENPESPAQNLDNEPSKIEPENILPKLKSIMASSHARLGSQDSSEKQVTFQDSTSNTESSIAKIKKVKFAKDTVFEPESKIKRVYRKPKRALTPGPQKPRFCYNPRFQALINRFENQGMTPARTPINTDRSKSQQETPPVGDHMNNPARAINFKEDSTAVESENYSKESNELFKSCIDTGENPDLDNAITALTANIAGSLQSCLSTVLSKSEEETEIQFKFVITKKKVSVKRIVEDYEGVNENLTDIDRGEDNKQSVWSSVARAVKNVFWGESTTNYAIYTPKRKSSNDSTSSSASKRKFEDLSDTELSPINYKRKKYEGRIEGRPPIRLSMKPQCEVSSLRSSHSAERESLTKGMQARDEDVLNRSF